jgi:hypothetical protein
MINIDWKLIKEIQPKLIQLFNKPIYIVGSYCIEGIKSNDIDILVLFNKPITRQKYRKYKYEIKKINPNLQFIPNFSNTFDNKLPHINLNDLNNKIIIKYNELTEEEYDILKQNMHYELYHRKDFLKEGII